MNVRFNAASSRAGAAALAIALLSSACGGSSGDETANTTNEPIAAATEAPVAAEPEVVLSEASEPEASDTEASDTEASVPQIAPVLPAVDVVDLASGETARLTSFARPGSTLLWFWAPH